MRDARPPVRPRRLLVVPFGSLGGRRVTGGSAVLPPLLVLTDRSQVPAGRTLVDQVRACVDGGARAVVLREKDLPRHDRRALAVPVQAALDAAGGRLVIASDRDLALDVGASGVHLAEHDPAPDPTVPLSCWGRSCHDTTLAGTDGCAYATLSPIFASASKPGYGPALGAPSLAAVSHASLAVLALGGIETPALAAACISAGADGVAVMGALMRADDPTAATAAFLDAVARVRAA